MDELPGSRIADGEVEELLGHLDSLLARIEEMPGAEGDLAREAVGALAEVYGEALARMLAVAADAPADRRLIADDPLLGQLLVLHGLHPDPPQRRVEQAIAEIQTALHGGATVELAGIEGGTAHLRVAASGCGSADLAQSIEEIVLAAAPELAGVDAAASAPAAFIPVEALNRRGRQ